MTSIIESTNGEIRKFGVGKNTNKYLMDKSHINIENINKSSSLSGKYFSFKSLSFNISIVFYYTTSILK